MSAMCRSNNMCNKKASTNMGSVKAIILVWDILKLMSFCTTMQGLCLPNTHKSQA
jgi:hypothetical protein